MYDVKEWDDYKVLLEKYLYEGNKVKFSQTLYQLHRNYLVLFFTDLTKDERKMFYDLVEVSKFAFFFPKMSFKKQEVVLNELSIEQSQYLMNKLRSDDLIICLRRFSKEKREEYLAFMSKQHARKLRRLLNYNKNQSASLMALEYLTVKPTDLIKDTVVKIRNQGNEIESISSIYVVNDLNELIGVVSLRRILMATADDYINNIMKEQVIFVRPHFAKRQIIKVVKEFDLIAIPVVSKNKELLGVITIYDVLKTKEASAKNMLQTKVTRLFRKKMKVYLSICLVLVLLMILAYTKVGVEEITLIVITSIVFAVTAGIVSTRYLLKMVDNLKKQRKQILQKKIKKELFSGFFLAIIVSVLSAFLVFGFVKTDTDLTVEISIAMFFVILSSTISGVFLPLILKWRKETKQSSIITTNAVVISLVTFSISLVLYQLI